MRHWRRFGLIATLGLGLGVTGVPAQEGESETTPADDQSFIESWLQDTLSGAGREITISGFAGALSSTATLDALTIADEAGIWFILRDVRLEWSRLALLRRRLEVNELSIGSIELIRSPVTQAQVAPEDAEATEFALPELPLNINVESVRADEIKLGAEVLGQEASFRLEGSALLAEGEARTDIALVELARNDRLSIGAGFSNETRVLAIDLLLQEDAGGLLTTLAGIPEAPEIEFSVQGEAPLSDYEARIALSSEGEPRLDGNVTISSIGDDEGAFGFGADLSGDLRPLLSAQMHPFFGQETALQLRGQTRAAGGMDLTQLALSTEALQMNGDLAIDAAGWPERFDLQGEIAAEGPIRLPSGGETPITLERLTLAAQHDSAQAPDWQAEIAIEGFDNTEFEIGEVELSASGTLSGGDLRSVTAAITLAAQEFVAADPALNEAIGTQIDGAADIAWQNGTPITLSDLTIEAGETTLMAEGELGSVADGLPVTGEASLRAGDLSRFSPLAGRDLAGIAEAEITGSGALLGGAFDLQLSAGTTALALSEPRLDPLLTGRSALTLVAQRTTEGTEIERFTLENDHLNADISGRLNAQSGQLEVAAVLSEVALVEPRISGPVRLRTGIDWTKEAPITLRELDLSAADAVLQGTGTLNPQDPALPVSGRFTLQSRDLSTLAELAGRAVAGQVEAVLEGSGEIMGETFDIALNAEARDLQSGVTQLDPLLAGRGNLDIRATRQGAAFGLETLTLTFPKLRASGSGNLGDASGDANLTARITDLAGVAEGLSGPASLEAQGIWDGDGKLTLTSLRAEAIDSLLEAAGSVRPNDPDLPADGRLSLRVPDLSRFADLVGRSLAGSLSLDMDGNGAIGAARLDADVNLDATGFRAGQAEIDALLGGDVTLDTSVSIGDGPPDIRRISLQSEGLQINASGEGPGTPVALAARLSNLGVFLPGFQGALSTEGTITVLDTEGRLLDIDLALAGPNGIQARLEGRAEDFGQELSLGLTGRAPVGAANRFIEPRTIEGVTDFDLRLDGAPGIEAISGRVTLSNARLSLPTLNNALTDLSGRVELAAGTAQITLGGSAGEGGRFDVTGPLNLAPPLNANLNVALRQLGISDPSLYSTSLTGDIGVSGALTRGPQIAGTISLGTTELRIPAGGAGPGAIPEITHRGEPSAVRITRKRAGLIEEATGGGGQPPQLDITVNAPNRVFLRGRGLDSELGGTIRVFGPTNDIGASGFFELIRGRLDILGKRLVLTEGLVDLRGALDPYLRIVAQTEADEVDINVIIEGLASSPEVSFTSSPELPEEEVAARLIFGKGIDQLSALQAARLVSAAATLSGRGGGLLGGIRGGLGLSDLDVGTTEDGGTEVRAGAYISDNLYSEIVVDSDGNEEINLNLDVSESLTVKGIASSDGNTGLGFFFERDY